MYSRVYVEITNRCNLQCSFCHGHHRPLRQMTLAEFDHVLMQLQGKTQYLYYHLMGEPLLHPDLAKLITLATHRGFHSMLTTNGTLLQKRKEELLPLGVHKYNLSLHSLENASEEDTRAYLASVADFSVAATQKGSIVVLRLWNRGCDGGENEKILSYLQTVFPGTWQENNRGLTIAPKLFLEWGERFAWPDHGAEDGGDRVSCYGMRDHFGILCDGTVVPCCLDSEGSIPLGNLFSRSLEEILGSPRAQAIKHGFECRRATEALCRKCGYARRF